MDKLKPFLYRKSARQRIMLFLMAKGYDFEALASMTTLELKDISMPDDDLHISKNQVLSSIAEGDLVFAYPGGRKMGEGDFFRVLTQASMKVLGKSVSLSEFQDYINSPS